MVEAITTSASSDSANTAGATNFTSQAKAEQNQYHLRQFNTPNRSSTIKKQFLEDEIKVDDGDDGVLDESMSPFQTPYRGAAMLGQAHNNNEAIASDDAND